MSAETDSSIEIKPEILVPLRGEGTDVWRPTKAVRTGKYYELLPTPDYDPEDEDWQFPPGTLVKGEFRETDKGLSLFAVEEIERK